jgi:putative transposase
MSRSARVVVPESPHHVVARGVNRHRLFASGYDKRRYLKRFADLAQQEQVLVHGFCLMNNHVHWLLTPLRPDSLARLFQRLHTWWAMDYNRRHQRCGHLFQNRYHSTPMEEDHHWTALRYVEVNPRRAGVASRLEEWEYSSARAHLSGQPDPLIPLVLAAWQARFGVAGWRAFLAETDVELEERLRKALAGSRPCGREGWLAGLERRYGRRLRWAPPGRPPASGRRAENPVRTLAAR